MSVSTSKTAGMRAAVYALRLIVAIAGAIAAILPVGRCGERAGLAEKAGPHRIAVRRGR